MQLEDILRERQTSLNISPLQLAEIREKVATLGKGI